MHGSDLFVGGTRGPSAGGAPSISIAFPVYEVSADAISFCEALDFRLLSRRKARML